MENIETEDQVDEGTESVEESTAQQVPEEQSETTEDVSEESKVYNVLGRDIAPDELYEEYKRTQVYINRLEQERAEREAKINEEVKTSLSRSELLANVDPTVKEALAELIRQEASTLLEEREMMAAKKASDEAFSKRLDALDGKFPGGNGLPKFDRKSVLASMQEPGNDIFDPEVKFMLMNKSVFDDFLIKQALKNKSGGPKTETSGGNSPKKPDASSPSTWEEAAKSAYSRL